jgi:hypothetical protein
LPLDTLTSAPPSGAVVFNVRVSVAVPPEATLLGLMPMALSHAVEAAAVTVTIASWLVPP